MALTQSALRYLRLATIFDFYIYISGMWRVFISPYVEAETSLSFPFWCFSPFSASFSLSLIHTHSHSYSLSLFFSFSLSHCGVNLCADWKKKIPFCLYNVEKKESKINTNTFYLTDTAIFHRDPGTSGILLNRAHKCEPKKKKRNEIKKKSRR